MLPEHRFRSRSSVLASETRGCRGSEDGLAGRQIALKHGVEESDRLGGGIVSEAQRGPGAGPRVAIQSLSEFLRDGLDEKKKRLYYNGLGKFVIFVSKRNI